MRRWANFVHNHSLFGAKKAKPECLLALDIGTEFVKALIFKIKKCVADDGAQRDRGVIVGLGRQRQEGGSMLAGAVADIESVALTCQQAIEQAVQIARARPRRVVIGVAGEFVKGAANNFVYKRKHPAQEIDLGELQNVIQRIQWRAFDSMRAQLAWESCRSEVEIKPINALLTDVRIDGYQVTNPLGFQGKEIFFSIFNVYAPLVHLRALEKIVAKLGLELLSVAAESYALTRCSNCSPTAGAVFIDIGGGTTDVALVKQGRVVGIKSLSLAGRAFTKRISQELGMGFAEAEEVKIRHTDSGLSPSVQVKIKSLLDKDIRVWLKGVELVLEEFEPNRDLPNSVFLCGGGSLLPGIKNILTSNAVQARWEDKFFAQPFRVSLIQPKHIRNMVDRTDSLKGAEIVTPLALAGLTLEIAMDERKTLPPILRRVVRIMR